MRFLTKVAKECYWWGALKGTRKQIRRVEPKKRDTVTESLFDSLHVVLTVFHPQSTNTNPPRVIGSCNLYETEPITKSQRARRNYREESAITEKHES